MEEDGTPHLLNTPFVDVSLSSSSILLDVLNQRWEEMKRETTKLSEPEGTKRMIHVCHVFLSVLFGLLYFKALTTHVHQRWKQ